MFINNELEIMKYRVIIKESNPKSELKTLLGVKLYTPPYQIYI